MDELYLNGVENACRNPDGDPSGPWCYLNNNLKDYCNIPFCRKYNMTF